MRDGLFKEKAASQPPLINPPHAPICNLARNNIQINIVFIKVLK